MPTLDQTSPTTHFHLKRKVFYIFKGDATHLLSDFHLENLDIEKKEVCPTFALQSCTLSLYTLLKHPELEKEIASSELKKKTKLLNHFSNDLDPKGEIVKTQSHWIQDYPIRRSQSEVNVEKSVDEFDAWQSPVLEQNQQIDCMLEDILINSSKPFIGDQPPTARKRYRNRVLAYGTSVDSVDEYFRMSATTTRDVLMNFVDGVILCFGDEYLRKPNNDDLARLLHAGDQRGFPGRAPKVSYIMNGRENDRAYYLTNGLYPSWSTFVKSITFPTIEKHKLFAQCQESARKDVERAFGVLQARFAFIRHPCLVWDKDNMGRIMIAYIILHNMLVEDERETYLHYYDPVEFLNDMPMNRQPESYTEDDSQPFGFSTDQIGNLASYMDNREQLRYREAHNALKMI
ncbi:hypothetical protein L6452_01773 [Arctium lappa]|uniref:Uncharacterized protein n=1 Tax=Arctium lappa TaxID=4217 RepID=A0ACB9FH12_ARCLA|nr:hypothetical protein L6452_01773 [Arctium lappa]